VRLALNPTEDLTFLAAVFQGDVFAQNVNRHGFDWNLNASNGYFWMTEGHWRHDFWLPGQIKVGAWFHTADFPNADGSASSYWGNYGIYFILDQMIYREKTAAASVLSRDEKSAASKPVVASDDEAQGLGVFARLAFDPQDRNFVGFYAEGGFNYKGLIPTRDSDILGAGIGYAQLTNGAKDVLASEGSVNPDYEIVIEVTYQAKITPWLILQPDIQYIIHPGGTRDHGNALILGARVVVTF
jgi:porin